MWGKSGFGDDWAAQAKGRMHLVQVQGLDLPVVEGAHHLP